MNLSELGKTSLVQHDLNLDDMTPLYQRIPPHQYEEVKKSHSRDVGDRNYLKIY